MTRNGPELTLQSRLKYISRNKEDKNPPNYRRSCSCKSDSSTQPSCNFKLFRMLATGKLFLLGPLASSSPSRDTTVPLSSSCSSPIIASSSMSPYFDMGKRGLGNGVPALVDDVIDTVVVTRGGAVEPPPVAEPYWYSC